MKSPPITLIFNSFTQRLIKIDLEFKSLIEQTGSELQSIKAEEIGHFITYKGKSFRRDSEREESVTKMLSRIMGPASKQTSTGVNQTVVIYPGVSFAITSTSSGELKN